MKNFSGRNEIGRLQTGTRNLRRRSRNTGIVAKIIDGALMELSTNGAFISQYTNVFTHIVQEALRGQHGDFF